MTSSLILKNIIVSFVLASIVFMGASAAFAQPVEGVSHCTPRARVTSQEASALAGKTRGDVTAGTPLSLSGTDGGENAIICTYSLIKFVTNIAVVVIVTVSIALFLYAAYLYLTSQGGEQTKTARSIIVAGVVGLIIAFVAQNIPSIVRGFLGA